MKNFSEYKRMNVAGNNSGTIKKRRHFAVGMPLRNDGFRKTLSPDPKANINQGKNI